MKLLWSLVLTSILSAQSGDTILAPGNPPLTQRLFDGAVWTWENFLEVKFTVDQRRQLQRLAENAWRTNDQKRIKTVLDDFKYAGKEEELRGVRESNQASYVEALRKDPRDPGNAILLAAYNAAHPDRGEIMLARGLGRMVGEWKTGGALLPTRDPLTGANRGITATDSLVLNIFSDGRFHHLWAHSHCDSGNTCCRQYSTTADGNLSVEGSKLVLHAASGNELFKDPCKPTSNLFQPLQQPHVVLEFSLRLDTATRATQLCLSDQPFNPAWNQRPGSQPKVVCYLKQ